MYVMQLSLKKDETYFDGIHIDVLSKIENKGIFNDTKERSKVAQKGPNINHFQKGSFWPVITEVKIHWFLQGA